MCKNINNPLFIIEYLMINYNYYVYVYLQLYISYTVFTILSKIIKNLKYCNIFNQYVINSHIDQKNTISRLS